MHVHHSPYHINHHRQCACIYPKADRNIQFNSIQFSLFPAHINISYNMDNVHIMLQEKGRTEDSAYERPPQTLTVVNYEHNYYCL